MMFYTRVPPEYISCYRAAAIRRPRCNIIIIVIITHSTGITGDRVDNVRVVFSTRISIPFAFPFHDPFGHPVGVHPSQTCATRHESE